MKSFYSNARILTRPVTAGWTGGGLAPIPGQSGKRNRRIGLGACTRGRTLQELGRPFPFPLLGERELPQVPQSPASPSHPRPFLARPSLGGHVSPSGSKVRASCGRASPWEGCAGGGHGSGPQPCRARVGRGEVPARQATPQLGALWAGGRGEAGPGKPPGRAPERRAGPLLLGRKARPAPPRARGRQRPLLVTPRS